MIIEVKITIDGSREAIWTAITNIENAAESVSGIDLIEVLEKPENGLVGFKWRETRTLFGKTATEVMWVTEAAENEYFEAKAESHGCVYLCTKSIAGEDGKCSLTMTHETSPQSFGAKLVAFPLGILFKGVFRKALLQDLNDIKAAVEQQNRKPE